MATQQKDCVNTYGEVETEGTREEVAVGEEINKARTRAAQKGEGSIVCTH